MDLKRYKNYFLFILIIAIVIILGNIAVLTSFDSANFISGFSTSDAEVKLFVATPPGTAPSTPPSGGGGTTVREEVYDFYLDQTLIKVVLVPGGFVEKIVNVRNMNDVALDFDVSSDLTDFVVVYDDSFLMEADSEKEVKIGFFAYDDVKPGIYTGHLIFKTQYGERTIPIIVEVRSDEVFFEANLDTPAEFKTLKVGEDISFQVSIFSVTGIDEGAVNVRYDVKDFNNQLIFSLEEDIFVERQISYLKVLPIGKDLGPGNYVVSVIATYGGVSSTSSEIFSVIRDVKEFPLGLILPLLFSIIFLLILIILLLKRRKDEEKRIITFVRYVPESISRTRKRINGKSLSDIDEAKKELRKLKKQKNLLNRAYKMRYIKKESYVSSKEKIEELIKKINKKYL